MTGADGVRLGIVADDLTGANDTAVQFAAAGWPTELALRPASGGAAADGVLAVSAGTRALGERARSVTAEAVRGVRSRGVSHLYLKVDSTFRGSVAAQVAGALDGWGAKGAIAVVCPAYPAMGRTVVDGVATAAGRRLEDGPAGRDPVTPVTTSVVTALLPAAVHLPLPGSGAVGDLAEAITTAASPVVALDASTDGDLDLVADAVAAVGPRLVPVGSAGLARALAARWQPAVAHRLPGPAALGEREGALVVLVSSQHEAARGQERLLRSRWPGPVLHLAPTSTQLLDREARSSWLAAALGDAGAPGLVVLTAPTDRSDPAAVATALADAVAVLHAAAPLRAVVAVGGDGAHALLTRWSASSIVVHGAVAEGVPHGVILGGDVAGMPLVTKAGGFGPPETLLDVVAHLTDRPAVEAHP